MEENVLRELQIYLHELDRAFRATPWRDKSVYGAFLAQTNYYVSHSTRLLALAASRFRFSEQQLHRRFIKHATEEMSHETLAQRDLKHLGLSLAQFPEFPATRAFYQTQYYMIEHVSPWSFLGYIVMLEGLAITKGPWLFDEIKQHHGEKAASFIKVHAAEDVEHMADAEKAMQSLPEQERPLVVEQIASSCFHYCTMLQQCATHAGAPFAFSPRFVSPEAQRA
jgi:thiaminase